ncbi:hypothetical protein JR316_0012166 [Psilocybe cubensis]|uniref:Uncharacterized protein n=2 Tax=Psilocybe cubensis TaxID=181762 RepID=A0A8H7XR76_PSICU|nr:hypothetical protein JR316_0012166 [Psilocybe cubensis]KAH9475062.1 hypothetical protein JR316_0012166 [Psilocybe cubensis]
MNPILKFPPFNFNSPTAGPSSNVAVLDLVPPSCVQACQTTSSSFQTCEYGMCICTQDNADGLEDCVSCLYAVSPSQDIYDAAQGIFSNFEDTCSPAFDFSLQIVPDYFNNGTTPTISIDPSISPTTDIPVPSQTAQWTVNNKQVCRAVRRKGGGVPMSSGIMLRARSAAEKKTSKPGWKLVGATLSIKGSRRDDMKVSNAALVWAFFTAKLLAAGEIGADGDSVETDDEDEDWDPGSDTCKGGIGKGSQ